MPIFLFKKSKERIIKKYFYSIVSGILLFIILLFIKDEYINYVSDICNNANDVSSYKGIPPKSCDEFYKYNLFYGVGWPVTLMFMSLFYAIYNLFVLIILKITKAV